MKGLYAIVDASITPRPQLSSLTLELIQGGASIVQYRDKTGTREQILATGKSILESCKRHDVPLVLNDHPDLCRAINADGVHLGKDDISVAEARKILGRNKIIGASCYNDLSLAISAEADGATYVAFGAVYSSTTKPSAPPASLKTLESAKQRLQLPIVAIGGITPDNGAAVVRAGADMLAAISGLTSSNRPRHSAQLYANLFKCQTKAK